MSTGFLNQVLPSRLATKSDSPVNDVVMPREHDVVALLRHVGQPQTLRDRLADFVEHVNRAALAAAQLLDERDALLELRLAGFELLHLRQDRPQLLHLAVRPSR